MTKLLPRETAFPELYELRRGFDDIFNRYLVGRPVFNEVFPAEKAYSFVPPVESYVNRETKKYICKLSIPGIEPKDLEIRVQNHTLVIKGERKIFKETKELELLEHEFIYGKFERVLELPEGVMTEKVVAEYVNGVLEVSAPMAEAALPHKIEIKTPAIAKHVAV
jgi:HSP20 family protein